MTNAVAVKATQMGRNMRRARSPVLPMAVEAATIAMMSTHATLM